MFVDQINGDGFQAACMHLQSHAHAQSEEPYYL